MANRTESISDIFQDMKILVEAHRIMRSEERMKFIKKVQEIQTIAIGNAEQATPLAESRSMSEVFLVRQM